MKNILVYTQTLIDPSTSEIYEGITLHKKDEKWADALTDPYCGSLAQVSYDQESKSFVLYKSQTVIGIADDKGRVYSQGFFSGFATAKSFRDYEDGLFFTLCVYNKPSTIFLNCFVKGKLVNVAKQYAKGSNISVSGTLYFRKPKNPNYGLDLSLNVRDITLLGGNKQEQKAPASNTPSSSLFDSAPSTQPETVF